MSTFTFEVLFSALNFCHEKLCSSINAKVKTTVTNFTPEVWLDSFLFNLV